MKRWTSVRINLLDNEKASNDGHEAPRTSARLIGVEGMTTTRTADTHGGGQCFFFELSFQGGVVQESIGINERWLVVIPPENETGLLHLFF